MFIRPCMTRQSNWEQVSMCFHLSPDGQMHRNNVEAASQFHYWKFVLYNVFVDNIVEELEDRFILPKPTFTAQLSILTNLHKMADDDQLIIKHAYEPDINGDAFYMECRRWKARWSGEQNPQAHWRPHWMPSCIQTSLSFRLFFWRFQWPLPLLKDLSAPWKESKHFFELPWQIPGLVHLALLNIHRDFRVDINSVTFFFFFLFFNSVTDSFNEKKNGKTHFNGKTLTLNNFDVPRTLFRIPKCNRLGTPPGVLSWADGRVLCVFSVLKEEYQYYPVNKERIQNARWMHQAFKV